MERYESDLWKYYSKVISLTAIVTCFVTIISATRLLTYSYKYYYFTFREERCRIFIIAILLIGSSLDNAIVNSVRFHKWIKEDSLLELWLDYF